MFSLDSKLSERELAFCLEYLKDFNGSRAVVDSGYSENKQSANKLAYDLINRPHISAYLEQQTIIANELAKRQGIMSKLEFVGELRSLLEFHKEVLVDSESGVTKMRNAGLAIKCLEMIGRHLGYFNQVIDDSKGDMQIIIQRPY